MRPLSASSLAVATAIQNGARHGFDIMDSTGLPSGTVYPVLGRLEKADLVSSDWEDPAVAQMEKRPARRYYSLTALGLEALAQSAEHYRAIAERVRVGKNHRTGGVDLEPDGATGT